jgi:hypothetical protein
MLDDAHPMDICLSILKVIKDSGGRHTFRPDGSDLRALQDFQVVAAAVEEHGRRGFIEAIRSHVSSQFPGHLIDLVAAEGLTPEGEDFLQENVQDP